MVPKKSRVAAAVGLVGTLDLCTDVDIDLLSPLSRLLDDCSLIAIHGLEKTRPMAMCCRRYTTEEFWEMNKYIEPESP